MGFVSIVTAEAVFEYITFEASFGDGDEVEELRAALQKALEIMSKDQINDLGELMEWAQERYI